MAAHKTTGGGHGTTNKNAAQTTTGDGHGGNNTTSKGKETPGITPRTNDTNTTNTTESPGLPPPSNKMTRSEKELVDFVGEDYDDEFDEDNDINMDNLTPKKSKRSKKTFHPPPPPPPSLSRARVTFNTHGIDNTLDEYKEALNPLFPGVAPDATINDILACIDSEAITDVNHVLDSIDIGAVDTSYIDDDHVWSFATAIEKNFNFFAKARPVICVVIYCGKRIEEGLKRLNLTQSRLHQSFYRILYEAVDGIGHEYFKWMRGSWNEQTYQQFKLAHTWSSYQLSQDERARITDARRSDATLPLSQTKDLFGPPPLRPSYPPITPPTTSNLQSKFTPTFTPNPSSRSTSSHSSSLRKSRGLRGFYGTATKGVKRIVRNDITDYCPRAKRHKAHHRYPITPINPPTTPVNTNSNSNSNTMQQSGNGGGNNQQQQNLNPLHPNNTGTNTNNNNNNNNGGNNNNNNNNNNGGNGGNNNIMQQINQLQQQINQLQREAQGQLADKLDALETAVTIADKKKIVFAHFEDTVNNNNTNVRLVNLLNSVLNTEDTQIEIYNQMINS